MPQQNTAFTVKDNVLVRRPRKYKVIFYNDDFTTMEFVIEVLTTIFRKTHPEAYRLMMDVHQKGKAVVGVYSYDIAMTRKNLTLKQAKENGFPLKVEVKPE